MRKRLLLLAAYWVVLSLCLSPGVTYLPSEMPQEVTRGALYASRGGLYVPPASLGVQLAPTLTGSANAAADPMAEGSDAQERAPLAIDTPEADYVALDFDREHAFVLQGTGEPGESVELLVNDVAASRKEAVIDEEGRWQVGVDRENLKVGEVGCVVRYAADKSHPVTWHSRLADELPAVSMPAYVAAGESGIEGRVQGDVQVTASMDKDTLPCILNVDGSFSVSGVTDLPVGSEVLVAAVDGLGNSVQAICMVVKPDSASLQLPINAPQAHRYLAEAAPQNDFQIAQADIFSAAEHAPDANKDLDNTPQTETPSSDATPLDATPLDATPLDATGLDAPAPGELETDEAKSNTEKADLLKPEGEGANEPYFPTGLQQGAEVEAYATLEGMTLPEIDDMAEAQLFGGEVRKRIRDMRKQMVLPIDLRKVGENGVKIPLIARGYRVGSVWIDPALESTPDGKENEGYVFSLELSVGDLKGQPRLQIVEKPAQLDALAVQGWKRATALAGTFYGFDDFVDADGLVWVYASVPVGFDTERAEFYRRDSQALDGWRMLWPKETGKRAK